MRIESIRTIPGPNIYSHNPVLWMRLYLDELDETESVEIAGFNERLIKLLPGVNEHYCSEGRPGGFVERLREGTYFGHIVEHVALELTELAGVPTFHGKTRKADEPGCYNVVIEYKAEAGTKFLLETAVSLVDALVKGEDFPLEERIAEAHPIIARTELGPSTRAIVDAASERGIPWFRIGEASLVQLGYGVHRRHIQAAICDSTRAVAVEIASDKELTKNLLEQASIPVPFGAVVNSPKEAIEAFEQIGRAVVVKPLNGRQGLGVSLNLTNAEQVAQAYHIASDFSKHVIVEELFSGRNYRVLVIDGKMVAASERMPPLVVGDGSRTIEQLIDIANSDPRRGDGHEKPLTRIKVDSVVKDHLAKIGLSLESVPSDGQVVVLREGINLSTGGTAKDVTDEVHQSVKELCERVARLVGMDVCGVDLMLEEISRPFKKGCGGVIEVNASPGLRMHLFPSEGKPRDVGKAIVEMLFPPASNGRIPIVSITGTNGKTTVTRMIAHMIRQSGRKVGFTTTDGIYIGDTCVLKGDTTGPASARTILCDPSVEVAVLETARGGIARRGLGYDWSDFAVMTNIAPDHIGQDGIRTVEDILHIKSLVAERVREGGTLILNADDEHLSRLMDLRRMNRIKRNVVYFSMHENSLLLKRHTAQGGTAYFIRQGWIIEANGTKEHRIVRASEIPATLGGAAEYNVANAMAAIAAARAYGMGCAEVANTILEFCSTQHNAGRSNLFKVNGGYVLLDYGHNPDAFAAVCKMASHWTDRQVTGVIGVPGDRDDSVILESGRAAASGFNRIVIKEDYDTRGRPRGEVASLLHRGVKEAAPARECFIEIDEIGAIAAEVSKIQSDDVLVIFFDKLEPVLAVLEGAGAVPVASMDRVAVKVSAGRG